MLIESRTLVTARGMHLTYRRKHILRTTAVVNALSGVDLDVYAGEVLGITGASGCGKSSLARVMAGMLKPDRGRISVECPVQIVFQDPGASLNPRFLASEIVEEPLAIARKSGRREKAAALLDKTGIDRADGSRICSEFSGGQRARLAIARALAAIDDGSEGLVIFDESFSSLDPATLDGMLLLLTALQTVERLTFLIISHDLYFLRRVATRIAVMDSGRIVDQGPTLDLLSRPGHRVTARLIECTPEAL